MFSAQKIIVAGDTLHHYLYDHKILYNEQKQAKEPIFRALAEIDREKVAKPTDNHNIYRLKRQVKHILQANAAQYRNSENVSFRPIFITFTFTENIKELKTANALFSKFTKRLNYQVFGAKTARLKYLAVPEFQKRGAVHYHVIYFNLPFIKNVYDFIKTTWGNSENYPVVKTIKNLNHLTSYVSKYFTKSGEDSRYFGEKRFFTSRGLFRPETYRHETACNWILRELPAPDFVGSFESNQIKTIYKCFTIPQNLKYFLRSSFARLLRSSQLAHELPVFATLVPALPPTPPQTDYIPIPA